VKRKHGGWEGKLSKNTELDCLIENKKVSIHQKEVSINKFLNLEDRG
jgi:hypothetical protein